MGETLRLCDKCNELKPLSQFNKVNDYFNFWCNKCRNRYLHSREKKRLEQYQVFLDRHPGYMKKHNRAYRETHKEKIRKLCKRYYKIRGVKK